MDNQQPCPAKIHFQRFFRCPSKLSGTGREMKHHLKHFLFMKRWRDSDKKGEQPAPNDAAVFSKKHRSNTVQTVDTEAEASEEEAPWKVGMFLSRLRVSFFAILLFLTRRIIVFFNDLIIENILADGPPREEDWWESDSSDDDDGSEHSVSLEGCETEEGGKKQLHAGREKHFRNCGLETWRRVQQAWRERDPRAVKISRSTSPKVKRDLVKALSGVRQFELPRRLPLKDLIGAYTEVWNGDASE
jgi:hypothetical protein